MKIRVLDSWPIVEWLKGSGGAAEAMDSLLEEANAGTTQLLLSRINAGEIYYFVRKRFDPADAEKWRVISETLPVKMETPTASSIWSAALLKGQFPISYADAFAAELALRHRCPLVTGDPEFRSIEGLEIDWIDR